MSTHVLPAPRLDARPRDRGSIAAGVWRVADPKITMASVASMILGAGAAAHDGPIAWGWLALTVLGIFCIEAAKNASGEIFDWDSGADQGLRDDERTPFSGGKRVLVDGLMTRRQTAVVAAVGYLVAAAVGLAIVQWREPDVLWLGVAGVAIAFCYHAPPLKLSYRGFGELAVALAYGPLIALGTYLVQRGHMSGALIATAVPLGMAIGAFLWVNELPDARADAAAGKRTLVVRVGRERAARWFFGIIVVANVTVAALPLFALPTTVWLGLAGLPHAIAAAARVEEFADQPKQLVRAQTWMLQSFLLMAIGLGAGWVLA
jgi:1,4-dihydroxy-2-naphthoate octaprenyltransferase